MEHRSTDRGSIGSTVERVNVAPGLSPSASGAATQREDATSIDREMDGWLPPDEVVWGEAPAATPELIEP